MSEEKESKIQALKVAIDQIEKQHGKGSIMKLGEGPIVKIDCISTGSISLDAALGIGEFPAEESPKFTDRNRQAKQRFAFTLSRKRKRRAGLRHSSMRNMHSIRRTQSASASILIICCCRSPSLASRLLRSSKCSSAAARWTSLSSIQSQR